MITFEHESYGTYARASYCADYLEMLAVAGMAPHWGDYDDYLQNNNVPLREVFRGGQVAIQQASGDDDVRLIRFVKNILNERFTVLGDSYPFQLGDDRLIARDISTSTYFGLLALCQLHVINDRAAVVPESAFEVCLYDAMRNVGLVADNVGTSMGRGFQGALQNACDVLGLVANPDGVTHPIRARDEDIDSICRFEFRDPRRGQWMLIGQATCASSNDWQRKAREPARNAWATYTSSWPAPQIFLAVPHHVQPDTWAFLLDHYDEGFVVDRLRIAAMRPEANDLERTAIARILAVGVENTE